MTTTETVFDGAKAGAFGGHIMSILKGSLLSSMVDIGHRTGLFAAAAEGWATSEQLAARAGLSERYVREWLGAVTTGGIVEYDEARQTFFLPPEHAALLTTPAGVAPLAVANTVLAKHVHQIVQAFREGGGVPYAAFTPEFTDAMDAMGRGVFDMMLLDSYIPLAPGTGQPPRRGLRHLRRRVTPRAGRGQLPDTMVALSAVSWPRLRSCSLASSEETWVSTVRTDRNSLAAMSALDSPSPSSRNTSASRAVTPRRASSAGTAAARRRRGTGPPASRSRLRTRSVYAAAPAVS
ncbi:MAG TPA: hypothetical protein VLW44_04875 [Streptosporangiaceae bacterium]|nr:hypothetical protein [Streptosporangiaceae bacterium]